MVATQAAKEAPTALATAARMPGMPTDATVDVGDGAPLFEGGVLTSNARLIAPVDSVERVSTTCPVSIATHEPAAAVRDASDDATRVGTPMPAEQPAPYEPTTVAEAANEVASDVAVVAAASMAVKQLSPGWSKQLQRHTDDRYDSDSEVEIVASGQEAQSATPMKNAELSEAPTVEPMAEEAVVASVGWVSEAKLVRVMGEGVEKKAVTPKASLKAATPKSSRRKLAAAKTAAEATAKAAKKVAAAKEAEAAAAEKVTARAEAMKAAEEAANAKAVVEAAAADASAQAAAAKAAVQMAAAEAAEKAAAAKLAREAALAKEAENAGGVAKWAVSEALVREASDCAGAAQQTGAAGVVSAQRAAAAAVAAKAIEQVMATAGAEDARVHMGLLTSPAANAGESARRVSAMGALASPGRALQPLCSPPHTVPLASVAPVHHELAMPSPPRGRRLPNLSPGGSAARLAHGTSAGAGEQVSLRHQRASSAGNSTSHQPRAVSPAVGLQPRPPSTPRSSRRGLRNTGSLAREHQEMDSRAIACKTSVATSAPMPAISQQHGGAGGPLSRAGRIKYQTQQRNGRRSHIEWIAAPSVVSHVFPLPPPTPPLLPHAGVLDGLSVQTVLPSATGFKLGWEHGYYLPMSRRHVHMEAFSLPNPGEGQKRPLARLGYMVSGVEVALAGPRVRVTGGRPTSSAPVRTSG